MLKAEEVALKQIELEQADSLKNKLPDFWLPSLTPTHAATAPQSLAEVDAGVKKLQSSCQGGTETHPIAFVLLLCLSSELSFLSFVQIEDADTREIYFVHFVDQ